MHRRYITLCVSLLAAACGDDGSTKDGQPNATSGGTQSGGAQSGGATLGTSETGGAAVTPKGGSSSLGGRSSNPASGGATNPTGGTNGQGGSVVAGTPCTADCPTGQVIVCFGDGCPLGECDDSGFYAGEPCSSVYTTPASSATVYCTAGESASYCLESLADDISFWAVTCASGSPQITYCPNGCRLPEGGISSCSG